MENYILRNRDRFSKRDYIRKADPQANYWFDFSAEKLAIYKAEFGDNFNLIVAGSGSDESDFFVIPFSVVKHLFAIDDLQDNRNRWVGSIYGKKLKMRHRNEMLDVSRFYGDFTRIKNDRPRIK